MNSLGSPLTHVLVLSPAGHPRARLAGDLASLENAHALIDAATLAERSVKCLL